MYSLYLYFLGLKFRNTSKALTIFSEEKRSHVSVWRWFKDLILASFTEGKEFLHS